MNNQLRSLIYANSAVAPAFTPPQVAAGGNGALFGSLAPPINHLSGTNLSNITVSGVSGLTAADIPTITSPQADLMCGIKVVCATG